MDSANLRYRGGCNWRIVWPVGREALLYCGVLGGSVDLAIRAETEILTEDILPIPIWLH